MQLYAFSHLSNFVTHSDNRRAVRIALFDRDTAKNQPKWEDARCIVETPSVPCLLDPHRNEDAWEHYYEHLLDMALAMLMNTFDVIPLTYNDWLVFPDV